MNEPTTAVAKTEDKVMEFVPFGSQDKIKLSIAIVKNLIAVKTRSGKTCSDNDAIKFMMMCQARRLNPFESDAYLIGYDSKDGPTFSLITAHQAFLKRAEVNPEYDGMKSGIIVNEGGELKDLEGDFYTEGQTVVGGWATVFFKTRKYPMHKRVRLSRFQKSFGVWQDDGAGMIVKCSEADALRSSFPNMLGGLYIKEETAVDAPKVSAPIFTEPEKRNRPGKADEPKPQEAEVVAEPEPEPEKPSYNVYKALKGLIKNAGVKEEDVLSLLVELGSVEPDVEKLEDVDADTLTLAHDQFDDIVDKIKQAKE
jgi:phage recombination protein Bet